MATTHKILTDRQTDRQTDRVVLSSFAAEKFIASYKRVHYVMETP